MNNHIPPSTSALLDRLHAKLGDFWWYSLTLFYAHGYPNCMVYGKQP